MEIHLPACWPQFHCIASACTHNCCIGWEIDIDEETAQRYRQTEGPLGKRFQQLIDWQAPDGPHFRLHNERCPFLDAQNLCQIQQELGEDGLCEICSQHPRFQNSYGNLLEMGLGLCCEEAARLIFTGPRPSMLLTKTDGEPAEKLENAPLLDPLLQLRSTMFQLLENPALPFSMRLGQLLSLAGEAQDWLSALPDKLPEALALPDFSLTPPAVSPGHFLPLFTSVVELFNQMEPVDEEWEEAIDRVTNWLSSLTEDKWRAAGQSLDSISLRQEEYLRLTEYLLYRYLLQCLSDRDLLTRVQMAVINCLMVRLMDLSEEKGANFTLKDRIRLAGLWSRQWEYSLDNLDMLADACFLDPALQYDQLIQMTAAF